MPTYQYRCEKCGKRFERTETISEHEAVKPQCPKCGSKKVTFVPGRGHPRRAKARSLRQHTGDWLEASTVTWL